MDFLDAKCDPQQALNMMHSLVLLIEGNMRKYHDPSLISAAVEQALRFCVRILVGNSPNLRSA